MAIPSVPQNCVINTANGQVALTWQQVVGASNYVIQRSTTGLVGSFSTLLVPLLIAFSDTTVTPGSQYWYYVCSQNSSGISNPAFVGTNGLALTATPCLPGQINLGYLRYMTRVRTEKLTSNFVTDDQFNFYINQSAFRLYDMLVGKYGDDYFLSPAIVIPMTGATYYPLPNGSNYLGSLAADGQFYVGQGSTPAPSCYKLNGVDMNVGGTLSGPAAGWIPCARQNWSDRDKYTYVGQQATLYNVFQMSYREMGNNVYVFPVNSNTTMRWYYVPMMTQLLQDTDMMPFSISGWSELVIVDVCVKVLVQEESFEEAAAFANERQALIDRINAIAPNRDVSQPNTVSNTRQTMGDPSFNGWGGAGGIGFGGNFGGF